MTGPPDLDPLVALAARMADAAGAATLAHFRADGLVADDKGAGGAYDPVTAADRAGERAIRAILEAERPLDGVLGEEETARPSRSGLTWVIDPIDGTRAFLSGAPTWGVLIALDDGARGRIGIVEQPFTGERFLGVLPATGRGRATLAHRGATRTLATRACPDVAAATLFATTPEMFDASEWAAFRSVSARARLTRFGIDCYAYALLAMGRIDLVIEAGLAPYDIAAPKVLVEAAGGVVTDWTGGDCRGGGRVIAAGDPALHAAVLPLLAG